MCIIKMMLATDGDREVGSSVSTEANSDVEMPGSPPPPGFYYEPNEEKDYASDDDVMFIEEVPKVPNDEHVGDIEIIGVRPGVSNPQVVEKSKMADNASEEKRGDDDLVKSISHELVKQRNRPPDINCSEIVIDISFHPHTNVLAAGLITGHTILYRYSNEANEAIRTVQVHRKASRDLEFSDKGDVIYSCGKDRSIVISDTETGQIIRRYDNSHKRPLYRLYELDENRICTSDDFGSIKVWDIRKKNAVMQFKDSNEFISDFKSTEETQFLVCTSGDGSLYTYNLNANKLYAQSEPYDTELNCLEFSKYDEKLLVGSGGGKIYFYDWGYFDSHSDQYLDIKNSINAMTAITDNICIFAFDDGFIRAYNFYPNKFVGLVGQHISSCEMIDISHDGELIASSSVDSIIKFWNIRYFEDLYVHKKKSRKRANVNLPSSGKENASDFFAGMV